MVKGQNLTPLRGGKRYVGYLYHELEDTPPVQILSRLFCAELYLLAREARSACQMSIDHSKRINQSIDTLFSQTKVPSP